MLFSPLENIRTPPVTRRSLTTDMWSDTMKKHGVQRYIFKSRVREVVFLFTLPETDIAPETLEDEFPFGMAYFQVLS